jgi:uncharacterized protein RhaS with RHS repeats
VNLNNVETYAYDANSNLIKSTGRKGQVTTYKYDANDRLQLMPMEKYSLVPTMTKTV